LSSLLAGGGGAASSVPGGQHPVYYAASWGGWCKVTVSLLLLPLNPLQYRRRARPLTGTPLIILVCPHITRIECSRLLSTSMQLTCYIFCNLHANCLRSSRSHDNCTNYEKKLFRNTLDSSLTMAAAVT